MKYSIQTISSSLCLKPTSMATSSSRYFCLSELTSALSFENCASRSFCSESKAEWHLLICSLICFTDDYRVVVLVNLRFDLHHQRRFDLPGLFEELVALVHTDQLVLFVLRLRVEAAELAGDAETLLAVHAAGLLPDFGVEPAEVQLDFFV